MISNDIVALKLHAKAFELCVSHFGARFKTYRQTPMLQITPEDLPVLGVYFLKDEAQPWGAANHAEPKFGHVFTLGLSGGVYAESMNQNVLPALESWMWELVEMLLIEPKFVNIADGVTGMTRMAQFAKVGETTLYEIRIEMQFAYQSYYPPKVVDDLDTIHVETRYPTADTDPNEVQQITRVYDLEQNS